MNPVRELGIARAQSIVEALAHKVHVPGPFTDHGGRLLTNVRVKPIFWGPQWLTLGHPPVPPGASVGDWTILFSPYMSKLSQYRGIGPGSIEPLGLATFDAGPPQGFTTADVEGMLRGLLDDRVIPDPATNAQLLAFVFTPPGINSEEADAAGYHTSIGYHGARLPYAWIGNDGTLGHISSVFSHELAEAATDPTNAGFIDDTGACEQTGACESPTTAMASDQARQRNSTAVCGCRRIGQSPTDGARCRTNGPCRVRRRAARR